MKFYSIDSNVRKTALLVMLFISFFVTKLINYLLSNILINVPSYLKSIISTLDFFGLSVTSVTLLGVFGVLYLLFRKVLWTIPIISKFHSIPNLNGTWKGELVSSYLTDGVPTRIEFSMEVRQDWDHISVICAFPRSTSHSITAFIFSNGESGVEFGFPYCNDSYCVDWKTKKHDGYNTFIVNGNSMKGRYFTNRESGTNGTMELKKIIKSKHRRMR